MMPTSAPIRPAVEGHAAFPDFEDLDRMRESNKPGS